MSKRVLAILAAVVLLIGLCVPQAQAGDKKKKVTTTYTFWLAQGYWGHGYYYYPPPPVVYTPAQPVYQVYYIPVVERPVRTYIDVVELPRTYKFFDEPPIKIENLNIVIGNNNNVNAGTGNTITNQTMVVSDWVTVRVLWKNGKELVFDGDIWIDFDAPPLPEGWKETYKDQYVQRGKDELGEYIKIGKHTYYRTKAVPK
ncbi:MAG: hypothetical protein G01um101425_849 [Candidatus Peregrinibacteria bacterium Gr01-1014_25]|nr:MAG: hypothetical protein G01um101425_849 [Candidatus Peregrinibacteria bacterium Gr01-1014_25]